MAVLLIGAEVVLVWSGFREGCRMVWSPHPSSAALRSSSIGRIA